MATRRYITIFGSIIGEKVSSLSLSQKIDRFWYGIPFRDKHIHVNWFFSRNERKYFVPLFPFLFFPFFFSLLFHGRINMPPVLASLDSILRERKYRRAIPVTLFHRGGFPALSVKLSKGRHYCTLSWPIPIHVVVPPPLYFIMYFIESLVQDVPSTKNRCQPGKRLTSATLVRLNDQFLQPI